MRKVSDRYREYRNQYGPYDSTLYLSDSFVCSECKDLHEVNVDDRYFFVPQKLLEAEVRGDL